MRLNRKLSDKELAAIRSYKGLIRIVGQLTVEKHSWARRTKTAYSEGNKEETQLLWTMRTWYGRSSKSTHYYSYRTEVLRDAAIDEVIRAERIAIETRKQHQEKMAGARASFTNPYKVGDVFSNSWGYDQTNVDFYEVVSITESTVTIREIGQHSEETGFMCGKCQPIRGKYIGGAKVKRVQLDGSGKPYVAAKYGWMSLWDGRPENYSNYA